RECFSHINKLPLFIESDIDCQVYVSVFNNDSIICAFRGTESTRDWLTDANMIRVSMDLDNVPDSERPLAHYGILRQFRSVEEKITNYIEKELDENNHISNIIYTGHSLGGALSAIALMNYSHKYPTLNHKCVTFGSPRVGDERFKERFQNSH
ncbi:MAG TPA: lipase family protein, partial [Myxococcales bacterium]|nr:lipase family protein [Myxococcales bacterium]